MPPIRLAIVEDQELFRRLLVGLCTTQFGYEVVCDVGTVRESLERIPPLRPDIVLLDLQLPDGDGLDVAEQLFEKLREVRVLVLTSLRDEVTIHRLREIGIQGFVDKNVQQPDVLRTAIETVASGRVYYAEVVQRVHREMRADPTSFPKVLSDREQELLQLLGRGLSNDEAAAQMGLTAWTVHSHRRNIMKKLGAATQAELIRYALRKGFVRPDASSF
ncbi:MAG TPA: response regulator transcription factor [Opitutaceae bacterium]|nr:response regulator transcription factor [Opitutaceae bacterium]